MDHTYNESNDVNNNVDLENISLSEQDELIAKLLSASDFLSSNDLDSVEEILLDIQELTENNQEE